ncbi:uncharacterized protein EV420DRAFT_1745046 [Desarmillaria tabescens]|uniref:Uncharacterized protein n=1 Tax=Armillaria tabescens TaxID=1929756 RepID=A0AA39NFX3_ARMTA|nr:uncharacterized protein EV420DRAFT_1745046 [Desarmillaria tabescens]KAK0464794.1 hypothetical protein EV420DRAFT_1745046 [Desarmillaria tabescens]
MSSSESAQHTDAGQLQSDEAAAQKLWRMIGARVAAYQSISACREAIANIDRLKSALDSMDEANETSQYLILGYIFEQSSKASKISDPVLVLQDVTTRAFLDQLDGEIKKVVEGEITFQSWKIPNSLPPDVLPHLTNLSLPTLTQNPHRPELLLYKLGSFQNNKDLQARVQPFLSHDHKIFVNSAGSGKTRLMMETLCQSWGFYLSCSPMLDTTSNLGSHDLWEAYDILFRLPGFTADVPTNKTDPSFLHNDELSKSLFTAVLLARLIIFYQFLRHVPPDQISNNVYKARWTALQVQPGMIRHFGDIFVSLLTHLQTLHRRALEEQCKSISACIAELLSPEDNHLLIVIDEAQIAAELLPSAFLSLSSTATVHRPLLRQIVESWCHALGRSCLGLSYHFIIAGSALSAKEIQEAVASSLQKGTSFVEAWDTGCFDDQSRQRDYVLQFIPDHLRNDQSITVLLERIWMWLRGRHRFTSNLLCLLITQGFQDPLVVFNAFVEHVAGFTPTDFILLPRQQALTASIPMFTDPLRKQFDQLEDEMKMELRNVAYKSFGSTARFLELGIARFCKEAHLGARIHEPLVLMAAVAYFNQLHSPFDNGLSAYVCKNFRNSPSDSTFRDYLAFYLASALAVPQKLGDLFSFPGGDHGLGSRHAHLVALRDFTENPTEPPRRYPIKGTWNVSGLNHRYLPEYGGLLTSRAADSKISEHTENYFGFVTHIRPDDHIGIFYPETAMGPSMLFLVELDDSSPDTLGQPQYLWIAVKVMVGQASRLSPFQIKQYVDAVTPKHFFKTYSDYYGQGHRLDLLRGMIEGIPEPNMCPEGGKYNVLRVLAGFPGQFEDIHRNDDDEDDHPLATLRMDRLKRPSQSTNPEQFIETMEEWLKKENWSPPNIH